MSLHLFLPPTPLDTFLQTPIPVLEDLMPSDQAFHLAGGRREQALMSKVEPGSTQWLCRMAALQRNRGRLLAALAYIGQAIEVAEREESQLDLAKGFAIRATIQVFQGNFDSARETLALIPPLARGTVTLEVMATYEETYAKLLLRAVGSTSFEFNEAAERCNRALGLYRDFRDVPGQIRCLITLSSITSGDGFYFRAVEHVDEGIRLSAQTDDWRYLNQLLGCTAFAFRDQGYRQNVDELFRLSIDWSTFIGDRPQRIRSTLGLGEFFRMTFTPPRPDGFEEGEELLKQAISEAEDCGLGPLLLEGQMALASLYQKSGDRESHRKCRAMAEKLAKAEAFEGASRVMDWNALMEQVLDYSRERRMASRLEEAIEGSIDPFFVFDMHEGGDPSHGDLMTEFRNSAANKLVGLDPTEVRTLTDLEGLKEFENLREHLVAAVTDRVTYEDEIRLERPNEGVLWFTRRVAPAGNGAVVTFRDTSSNRKIEEALREAAEKASEADRAKSEFLANMSHEIRTPINGVLGLAQLLHELDLEPIARKYVNGIQASGAILLKVIGDVLDLSKIEARKMQIQVAPVQVQNLVQEVVSLFEGSAAASSVKLEWSVSDQVPKVVMFDGSYVRQILANLVGNAIKFTRNGSVWVRVDRFEDQLRLEVQDTGIGVHEQLLDKIFEPFQRAGSEADGIDGTGLGLTISRRLVELMGGHIHVRSRPNEGSCFTISLPLEESHLSGVDEAQPETKQELRFDDLRVLLVEDNVVNVMVSEGMLTQLGCRCDHAENGQAALDLFELNEYDLVLMDVRMPVMDGLEATRQIRRREAGTGRRIPIIALTAGALSQEREACYSAGMDDYLVKPFSRVLLGGAMHRAFPDWNS